VDVAGLETLHQIYVKFLMQGVHPDLSAVQMRLLTAKMSPKDLGGLQKALPCPGFVEQWNQLDEAAKEFAGRLTSKETNLASDTWKLIANYQPEPVLWLAFTSKSSAVQAKFHNFFEVWPEARQKIPTQLMAEMRITADLAEYGPLLNEIFFGLIDGKLESEEAMRAFLEPYSPPAPPPPVTIRRSRKSKAEVRARLLQEEEEEAASTDEEEDEEEHEEEEFEGEEHDEGYDESEDEEESLKPVRAGKSSRPVKAPHRAKAEKPAEPVEAPRVEKEEKKAKAKPEKAAKPAVKEAAPKKEAAVKPAAKKAEAAKAKPAAAPKKAAKAPATPVKTAKAAPAKKAPAKAAPAKGAPKPAAKKAASVKAAKKAPAKPAAKKAVAKKKR
jgi:hypothetical protein